MKSTTLPAPISDISESITKGKFPISRRWLIGGVIVLMAIFASSKFFVHKKPEASNAHAPVLTVTTQPASIRSIERILVVHGTVSAWDPISVSATAGGLEVKKILVDDGFLVKKNQLLAILDSDQLQAQIESERAKLAASISNIDKSIQPNRPEDINGLAASASQAQANIGDQEAGLLQAKANLENAGINLKRYQNLRSEGAVSAQETETRETNMQVCQAAVIAAEKRVEAAKFVLRQAEERLSMAHLGGRQEDIQIARANMAEIKANIKRLQTQINQTFIKAPVAGLITKRDIHLGDVSTVGKIMFSMTRDNRLELKAQVPETDLSLIRPGQIVLINSSLLNKETQGNVREISPLVDSDSRLATVRIDMPNTCGLKQGMYAEGKINVGRKTSLTIPAQALISRDEKNTVFVLHNDQVESRPVTVGNRNSNFVEISSGLTNNEQVVIEGAGFLKNGDYVAVAH